LLGISRQSLKLNIIIKAGIISHNKPFTRKNKKVKEAIFLISLFLLIRCTCPI